MLEATNNTGAEHVYHQQALDDSQPYFPQCIPLIRFNPDDLWVH